MLLTNDDDVIVDDDEGDWAAVTANVRGRAIAVFMLTTGCCSLWGASCFRNYVPRGGKLGRWGHALGHFTSRSLVPSVGWRDPSTIARSSSDVADNLWKSPRTALLCRSDHHATWGWSALQHLVVSLISHTAKAVVVYILESRQSTVSLEIESAIAKRVAVVGLAQAPLFAAILFFYPLYLCHFVPLTTTPFKRHNQTRQQSERDHSTNIIK